MSANTKRQPRTGATAASVPQDTIGAALERHRLEHRAIRLQLALGALRRISDARTAQGAVPVPLHRAIATFSQELADVHDRLTEL